ncbi:MAG: hypothetical protein ACT4P5_10825 [Armatimonadota bacterium]
MAEPSSYRVQKAKQSLARKLMGELGFIGAGLSTRKSGQREIIVLITDAASPVASKVPKEWQGISVKMKVGGIPRRF